MALSDLAQRIYDRLPEDCTKAGGITLQRELEISKVEYQKGRDELKAEGLVVSGAGRGGSLGRVEGKEPEAKKTKTEALEIAREEKGARSRAKKEHEKQIELIIDYFAKEGYPIDRRDISFSDGRPVAAVWDADGKRASMYGIPEAEWSRLIGRY